jgi:hypothetical protein
MGLASLEIGRGRGNEFGNTNYSVCTAATGAILHARRRVAEEIADNPMCFIFPSLVDYRK